VSELENVERPAFRHERRRRGLVGPFSGRQLIGVFVAVVAVAVVFIVITTPLGQLGVTGPTDPKPTQYIIEEPPAEGLRPGDLAPELAVDRDDGSTYQLTDLDGDPVRLDALRGRAVWINFWAHWCPPCQSETPVLRDIADEYESRGLTVIGVSVQETSEADVRDYAERYGLEYTVAADLEADIYHRYKVFGLPTQFFIDPNGVVREVVNGPLDEAAARRLVESILPPSAAVPRTGTASV
jgi:peroxiredoxin